MYTEIIKVLTVLASNNSLMVPFFSNYPHHPTVLFVLKPVSEYPDSDLTGGLGLGSLGLAGSTKITHPCKYLAFIFSLAVSASSMEVYVTKPNPFDLPVALSLMTLAAISLKQNISG